MEKDVEEARSLRPSSYYDTYEEKVAMTMTGLMLNVHAEDKINRKKVPIKH